MADLFDLMYSLVRTETNQDHNRMQATYMLVLIIGLFLTLARLSPRRIIWLTACVFLLSWLATTAAGYLIVVSGLYAEISGSQDSGILRNTIEAGLIVLAVFLLALLVNSQTRMGAMYFPVRTVALFWLVIAARSLTVFFPTNPGLLPMPEFMLWQNEVVRIRKLSDILFGVSIAMFVALSLRSLMQRLRDHLWPVGATA